MKLLRNLGFLALLALAGCRVTDQNANEAAPREEQAKVAPILTTPDAVDPHTYARPLEARVTHVALDLAVDFEAKRIGGTATLDIEKKPEAQEIVLDSKGLEIESISDSEGQLKWQVGASDPQLGAPLRIALGPPESGDRERITIRYKSAPDAGALQWLTAQQTAGKKAPFLFSQGQAIENRSWIPTQDSPGIRQTWEATIRVPAGITVVMSAPRGAEPITQGGESVFNFRMANSVAPYMIAIAAGDLAFRSLGPRTGVWAEPVTIGGAGTMSWCCLPRSRSAAWKIRS
jgi:aminopeptidase N